MSLLDFSVFEDAGPYRSTMEDVTLTCVSLPKHPHLSVFAVFDGHSGSQVAKYVASQFVSIVDDLDKPTDQSALVAAMYQLDKTLIETEDMKGGTCAVFAIIDTQTWSVLIGNIGDSRCCKVKTDGSVETLSEDHTPNMKSERERAIRNGMRILGRFRKEVYCPETDYHILITRALGDKLFKQNKSVPLSEQALICEPEFKSTILHPNEILLLFSDGVVEKLESNEKLVEQMQRHMAEIPDYSTISTLVEKCTLCIKIAAYKSGTTDNHSGIAVTRTTQTSPR